MFNLFSRPKEKEFEQQKELQKMGSTDGIIAGELMPEKEDIAAKAYMQEQKDSLTKWQQNLEPELQQLTHDLKKEVMTGFTKDDEEMWTAVDDNPVCTDEFVHRFLTKARPFMTKNLMMSNYSEERILHILRFALIDMVTDVGYNRKKYKIDKGDMDHVVQVFKSYITPTLFRPMQQGERKHIGTTYRDSQIKTVQETGQERKRVRLF